VIAVTGLVAWYLLAVQVLLGAVYAAGLGRLLISARAKLQLHQWVSAGLLVAVGAHVATIVLSHFHGWDLYQALELGPGTIARNCGAAALWLLVVVVLTRWRPLTRALGARPSRVLHRSSYLVLLFGTLHAVLAGPHAGSLVVAGPGIACLTALAAAFVSRHHKNLTRRHGRGPQARSLRPTAQHRA
jgi:DMSO/TMAO reductase YedYZ heme-binding membrane subunit